MQSSPARAAALRRMPRQTSVHRIHIQPILALGVVLLILAGVGIFLEQPKTQTHTAVLNPSLELTPVAISVPAAKPVHLEFDPPLPLNDQQNDNKNMVVAIIQDPSSWGLNDKKPIKELTGNILQVYLSTLYRENHFYHYNSNGDVQMSDGTSPCCAGIGQVYTLTSVCEGWELKDIRRNAWCSARIFANYYDDLKDRAGDQTNVLTVAMYQNTIQLDDNKNPIPDANGLPQVSPDSEIRAQLDSVFTYTDDNGVKHSMFRFVSD